MPSVVELEMLAVYAALLSGLALAGTKGRWFTGLTILLVCAVAVNARYFLFSVGEAIAFFNGLYDTFLLWNGGPQLYFQSLFGFEAAPAEVNVTGMPGMAPCDPNWPDCGMLGYYAVHPSWAAQFYNRFVDGLNGVDRSSRRLMLRIHIFFNTFALVLSFVQIFVLPGTKNPSLHKTMGWLTVVCVSVGASMGMRMGSEHGDIKEYGGGWAVAGWVSMYLCTMVPLVIGIRAAMTKQLQAHRIWMIRFHGAMWGAFWAFRIHFILVGPIFIQSVDATTLWAVWTGAPTGIIVAEWAGKRKGAAPSPFLKAAEKTA